MKLSKRSIAVKFHLVGLIYTLLSKSCFTDNTDMCFQLEKYQNEIKLLMAQTYIKALARLIESEDNKLENGGSFQDLGMHIKEEQEGALV